MASMNGLSKLGLPKFSDNMDPEDPGHCAAICTRCRSSCSMY